MQPSTHCLWLECKTQSPDYKATLMVSLATSTARMTNRSDSAAEAETVQDSIQQTEPSDDVGSAHLEVEEGLHKDNHSRCCQQDRLATCASEVHGADIHSLEATEAAAVARTDFRRTEDGRKTAEQRVQECAAADTAAAGMRSKVVGRCASKIAVDRTLLPSADGQMAEAQMVTGCHLADWSVSIPVEGASASRLAVAAGCESAAVEQRKPGPAVEREGTAAAVAGPAAAGAEGAAGAAGSVAAGMRK